MNTTHTRNKSITAAVGAAIAAVAAPALLFLGAGTAQAIQDSESGRVAIIDDAGNCPRCGGFNPQPDPPGTAMVYGEEENRPGIEAPGSSKGVHPEPRMRGVQDSE